jgi:protein tyrosine phosphatase (PTP) superfamily phosphohydrolase (DUF442 family)
VPVIRKAIALAAVLAALTAAFPLPAADGDDEHEGPVMNYHRIDQRLVTGGHFVDDGLATLKAEGVTVVIDLRDKPPGGQQARLAREGIEWISVPVEWENPEPADFERFRAAMQAHRGDHVLVQCSANYRASAMTYLYRVVVEQVDENAAAIDLHAVWTPNEESKKWSDYIDGIKNSGR